MWQIVNMAQQAASCDSLVRYQEVEINKMIQEQGSADQLLRIRTEELWLSQVEADTLRRAIKKQDQLTKASVSAMKAKKNKWEGAAIGATTGGLAFGPVGAGVGALAGYLVGSMIAAKK